MPDVRSESVLIVSFVLDKFKRVPSVHVVESDVSRIDCQDNLLKICHLRKPLALELPLCRIYEQRIEVRGIERNTSKLCVDISSAFENPTFIGLDCAAEDINGAVHVQHVSGVVEEDDRLLTIGRYAQAEVLDSAIPRLHGVVRLDIGSKQQGKLSMILFGDMCVI